MSLLLFGAAVLLVIMHARAVAAYAVAAAERGATVVIDVPTLSLLVREGTARALFFLLRPLGNGQAPCRPALVDPEALERPRPPVLLVPGHFANRSAMMFLRTFLVQRGWPWVWAVNVHARDGKIADMAVELARCVDEMQRVTAAHKVDIVAWSQGGLVAAWYVHHLGGRDKVRRLVTLGTPWKGTKSAVFVRTPAGSEMRYGSPALDGLAPPGVPTVSVWSPDDAVVVPASSATPDGVDTVCIEGLGHAEMVLSTRAFRAVQAALGEIA